ncbi:MAG: hypothetical protein H0W64_10120 [Gammaproteobacteria bacterium]|nr:hypothetical protein [Gammaproteobacteria bacterium]
MPRDISQFKGAALIVGGGWSEDSDSTPSIRTPHNFYTIDIDAQVAPDAVIDITNENQCSALPPQRFSFIYFECFPWLGEERLLKAFDLAHRLLTEDGFLIYRGGSNKAASSIPAILQKAGYQHVLKKELNPADPKTQFDNGSISLAANLDLKVLQENFSTLSKAQQYYLNYYHFFMEEPFSFNPYYALKVNKPPHSNFIFSIYKQSNMGKTPNSIQENNESHSNASNEYKTFTQ